LVLRQDDHTGLLRVLDIDGKPALLNMPVAGVFPNGSAELDQMRLKNFLTGCVVVAMREGHLFQPDRPLTFREQIEVGPARCRKCRAVLEVGIGLLGCTVCKYYACRCGTCLCGYPGGRNWQGKMIPPFPTLPCSLDERVEYVRVCMALLKNDRFTTA
jgi:hypothetical protein